MGWPIVAAAGIAAASAMHQQLSGAKAQEKANEQNFNFQREMAQNSIQYRVQDARKAGIHPLYALGAQPYQATPSAIAPDMSAIGQAGANIANLVANYKQNQQQREMNDLQIENMRLQNDRMRMQNQVEYLNSVKPMGQSLYSVGTSQVRNLHENDTVSSQNRVTSPVNKTIAGRYTLDPITQDFYTLTPNNQFADMSSEAINYRIEDAQTRYVDSVFKDYVARTETARLRDLGDLRSDEYLVPAMRGAIPGFEVRKVRSSKMVYDPVYLHGSKTRRNTVFYGE